MDGKVKRGTPLRCAFRPDAPAVTREDSMHERETHSGAGELFLRVQALEDIEQLVRELHVESGTIVAHAVHGQPVGRTRASPARGCSS